MRRRRAGDQCTAGRRALIDLCRHHRQGLLGVAEDAETHVMARRPSRAGPRSGPSRARCMSRRPASSRRTSSWSWPVPTRVTASEPSSSSWPALGPWSTVPCSGVNEPKKTTRSGSAFGPSAARCRPASNQSVGRSHRHDHGTARRACAGRRAALSSVSTTTTSAARGATAVEQSATGRSFRPPDSPRSRAVAVAGDQEVQDDDAAGPAQASQQHVEVTQVWDQHGVRPAPDRAAARANSRAQQPARRATRPREPPRLLQHGHAIGGAQAQGRVHLDHVEARGRPDRRSGRPPAGARRCRTSRR